MKQNKKYNQSLRIFVLSVIIFALCLFAGLRTRYNDTYSYLIAFGKTPKKFSALFAGDFSVSAVYFFRIWGYVIYNYISTSVNVYFFLSSLVFVIPSILLIEKYSKNFVLSILLYMFAGMYLFSLAGLKQAMATGIVLMGIPALLKKQYLKYYIFCILALGFHTYSLFFLIVPLLGSDKIFNKTTVWFCIVIILLGIGLSYFSSFITKIIQLLGKDIQEETLQEGSVNIFRAIVFLIPLVLTLLSYKKIDKESSAENKIFVKISILSTMFMVLALFGNPILFGRIPQYFYIGIVVSLPYLIEKTFVYREVRFIKIIAGFCYIMFGIYSLYKDGAFAMDIFRLVWFI
ncbi:MAG: EpsG family protein [Clostridia bacterium]|nr:EpsG family protein [Clostridia bacterium]